MPKRGRKDENLVFVLVGDELFVAVHAENIGLIMLLQHHTKPFVAAVNAITKNPGTRHAGRESGLHHFGADLRFGCKNYIVDLSN